VVNLKNGVEASKIPKAGYRISGPIAFGEAIRKTFDDRLAVGRSFVPALQFLNDLTADKPVSENHAGVNSVDNA
jgi:hypothetical protein